MARLSSPPRRHSKRSYDAPGQTKPAVVWVTRVHLHVGGLDKPSSLVPIKHSSQYHLIDSARANALRLGPNDEAVDDLASFIEQSMLPLILEAERTGVAPSGVRVEVADSDEPEKETEASDRPTKRMRGRHDASPADPYKMEQVEDGPPSSVKEVDSEREPEAFDCDENAMSVDDRFEVQRKVS